MSWNESAPAGRPSLPVVVVIGGAAPPADLVPDLGLSTSPGVVVAADRGVDHALALGWTVHIAVGDFDSVSADGLDRVRAGGGELRRHPTAKDATDLELALEAAVGEGATEIIVLGGSPTGRLDHYVANLACLTSSRWHAIDMRARLGDLGVTIVPPGSKRRIPTTAGQIVTLLAYGGPASIATSSGLRWPTDGLTLDSGSSLGVSNEATGDLVALAVESGTVAVLVVDDDSS